MPAAWLGWMSGNCVSRILWACVWDFPVVEWRVIEHRAGGSRLYNETRTKMSQQHRKVTKRKRRSAYIRRRKEQAKVSYTGAGIPMARRVVPEESEVVTEVVAKAPAKTAKKASTGKSAGEGGRTTEAKVKKAPAKKAPARKAPSKKEVKDVKAAKEAKEEKEVQEAKESEPQESQAE